MEALLTMTLFGSIFWFWTSVLVFIVVCFISDINKNGFAAFISLIIVLALYFFWGDVKAILPFINMINIIVYLLIGLYFSAFRTFMAGRKLGKAIKNLPSKIKKEGTDYGTKEREKEGEIRELKNNVFRWWFMWPVSLLTWGKDFISEFWDWVYSKLKNFYTYLLNLGIESIK